MSSSFALDGKRLRFAADTHIGRKREHNEDSVALPDGMRLAIVADGMGGHASGEVASRMAVDVVTNYYRRTADTQTLTWPYKVDRDLRAESNRMTSAIMLANIEIWERAQKEGKSKGMGTTCVAMSVLDDAIVIGHVGDSRVYRLRGAAFTQITEDHSLINDYVKMKRVTPEEAESWPQKNVIVRALGMKESVQVDILTETPIAGDLYLLCSDGLTGMLTDAQIAHIVRAERDLDTAVNKLIEAANEEGGGDNISVILARIEEAS